jgi:hypothetical protein
VQDASELVGIRANVLLEWISVGQFRSVRDVGRLIPEQYFFTEADIKRLMAAVAASVSSIRAGSGPKMLTWSPKPDDGLHYSTEELAIAWGLSTHIVRGMFENESGVLKPSPGDSKRMRRATLRIPSDVVVRVWHRLCG